VPCSAKGRADAERPISVWVRKGESDYLGFNKRGKKLARGERHADVRKKEGEGVRHSGEGRGGSPSDKAGNRLNELRKETSYREKKSPSRSYWKGSREGGDLKGGRDKTS